MLLRVLLGSAFFIRTLAAAVPNAIPNMTEPPKSGKVELYPEERSNLDAGRRLDRLPGHKPEAVPVEIVGIWENAWGPKQNIIIGKMGGKATRTNVAGGMSGSPVYIDGKLVGAISLRLSVFSPDAICGITPIDSCSKSATSIKHARPILFRPVPLLALTPLCLSRLASRNASWPPVPPKASATSP